jgi:ABC-2 type transport system ATP-binding protein
VKGDTLPIIEVSNLVKRYPGIVAVDKVSLSITKGICFGLLGPNGAGKTTTIEIMEGITIPDSGSVLYKGNPLASSFKQEAGIQFQSTALQDFLTVGETLQMFKGLYRNSMDIAELTEICRLDDIWHRETKKLSGGQRQRLLFAIALVNDPQVIFLDEPTTGLDPHARRYFWTLIETIKKRGKTILLSTHYMEEAYSLCDEIAIMKTGKIVAQGSPHTLLKLHFKDAVVTLPVEDFTLPQENFPEPLFIHHDRVNISSDDTDSTIRYLIQHNVSLKRMEIRPRTLEDLFIDITNTE